MELGRRPAFPHAGFHVSADRRREGLSTSSTVGFSALQFRKTWSWLDAFWTLKIGGEPNPEYRSFLAETQMFAFTYARPLQAGDNVRRGRWYIEPGYGLPGFAPGGVHIYEAGLKIGYRADTRMFGIVDLYLIGSVDVNQ